MSFILVVIFFQFKFANICFTYLLFLWILIFTLHITREKILDWLEQCFSIFDVKILKLSNNRLFKIVLQTCYIRRMLKGIDCFWSLKILLFKQLIIASLNVLTKWLVNVSFFQYFGLPHAFHILFIYFNWKIYFRFLKLIFLIKLFKLILNELNLHHKLFFSTS